MKKGKILNMKIENMRLMPKRMLKKCQMNILINCQISNMSKIIYRIILSMICFSFVSFQKPNYKIRYPVNSYLEESELCCAQYFSLKTNDSLVFSHGNGIVYNIFSIPYNKYIICIKYENTFVSYYYIYKCYCYKGEKIEKSQIIGELFREENKENNIYIYINECCPLKTFSNNQIFRWLKAINI